MSYSWKSIDKAWDLLISDNISNSDSKDAMDRLSYWRSTFSFPLDLAFTALQNIWSKHDKNAIYAKRMKRYLSVVSKLKRYELENKEKNNVKMTLRSLQDIWGCRIVVANNKKVQKVVNDLKKLKEVRLTGENIRVTDYIKKPKDSGYRSIHVIWKFPNADWDLKKIEIQVRSRLQHDWATSLEIIDIFTKQALKTSWWEKWWETFFLNVSQQFAVIERESTYYLNPWLAFSNYVKELKNNKELYKSFLQVKTLYKKLSVIEKFTAFTESVKVVDQSFSKDQVWYLLFNINLNEQSIETSFFGKDDAIRAEKEYALLEQETKDINYVVVALVSSWKVWWMKEAYPNYYADSKNFLKYLNTIKNIEI